MTIEASALHFELSAVESDLEGNAVPQDLIMSYILSEFSLSAERR